MYFIAAFGLLMLLFSLVMVARPAAFANGIIAFSERPYFHIVEVVSRIIAGVIFIQYCADTRFLAIGIVLLCVGIGLACTPPSKHRKFALWSAQAFNNQFRLIGVVSVPLSLLLIYAAGVV
ncbi:hypothetical protein [Shewanella mangrovisoli]|uniref:hypothetical protein n=1 Tax=Shewanella mangrovisoli TaxID=2864211 RepID=UPI0035B82C9A